VAPDERHPVDGRRYADLWAEFEGEGPNGAELPPVDLDLTAEATG